MSNLLFKLLSSTSGGGAPRTHVLLLVGQSNMAGRNGPIDPVLDATDPRILQLNRTVSLGEDVSGETAILAADPLKHVGPVANTIGLGMTWVKNYLATLPAVDQILLVPAAQGSTSFAGDDWNIGDPNYEDAIARANHAMTLYSNSVFAGILWHQGEGDGGTSETVQSRQLDTLIATMRDRITGASQSTPFVCGDLISVSNGTGVRAALSNIESRVPYSGFAPSTDLVSELGGTDPHFDAPSLRIFGERYWEQFNGGLSGSLSMSAPAKPSVSATDDESGQTTLTVTAGSLGGSAVRHVLVYYKLEGDSDYTPLLRKASDSLSIVIDGLTNDETYDIYAQIVTSAGVSVASDVVQATPAGSAIVPLTDLNANVVMDFSSYYYDGSSKTWTNQAAGTTESDAWVGASASVDGTEPAFTGTPNTGTAAFDMDGTDDHFRLKTATAFTNNLHRSDSTQAFTAMGHFYYDDVSDRMLFCTCALNASAGTAIFVSTTSDALRTRVYNSAGANTNLFLSTGLSPSLAFTPNAVNTFAFGIDPVTRDYIAMINDDYRTGTLGSWTNTDAITTSMAIGADINGGFRLGAGTEVYNMAMAKGLLTQAQIEPLIAQMINRRA